MELEPAGLSGSLGTKNEGQGVRGCGCGLVFGVFFFFCCCWIEGSCDKVGSHHSWHPEMSSAPNRFPCFARRKSLPLHPPAGSTAPCPSPSRRRPRSNRPRTLVLKDIAAWGSPEVKVVLLDGSGDVASPKMQFYYFFKLKV